MANVNVTTLNRILGAAGFAVFLGMYVVGPLVGWTPSRFMSVLLVASYMTLLGFGELVEIVAGGWGA